MQEKKHFTLKSGLGGGPSFASCTSTSLSTLDVTALAATPDGTPAPAVFVVGGSAIRQLPVPTCRAANKPCASNQCGAALDGCDAPAACESCPNGVDMCSSADGGQPPECLSAACVPMTPVCRAGESCGYKVNNCGKIVGCGVCGPEKVCGSDNGAAVGANTCGAWLTIADLQALAEEERPRQLVVTQDRLYWATATGIWFVGTTSKGSRVPSRLLRHPVAIQGLAADPARPALYFVDANELAYRVSL